MTLHLRPISLADDYADFLKRKIAVAQTAGFEVEQGEINPQLKDFVREAVIPWAAHGGRRAIFSKFGLHKTSTQIELGRLALTKVGAVPLIVMPLAMRSEFLEEAETRFTGDFAVRMRFIRTTSEADEHSINITNFESVREGKIDTAKFGLASIDEAAVLRGFGGTKIFREFMRQFERVRFKFVATAVPDPNNFIELLAYAAYLGIMDVGQAKTRFFKRDSENADNLTIHPHKEREFWMWVASWALFINRPSDLGYSDDGYVLPPLDVHWHEIPSDHTKAGTEKSGQARLFTNASNGVVDAAREKRDSLASRIAKLEEIRAIDPEAHRIIWHDLEDERRAINNDSVLECAAMEANSVDMIVTSIPFATQYEYTPSYNDFGHTDDDAHFWAQMDYLTPNLLRVLKPGRVAAIHVKDRIVPGGMTGLGFQTVSPFSHDCVRHFRKHGFAYLGPVIITTDVVRENNQTYRLGWTEQCKDGSRMGPGLPEYLLIFRKPPTDASNGYADVPVVKEKPLYDDHGEPAPFDKKTNWKQPIPGTGYSRSRWQLDAHDYHRSGGDRLLTPGELRELAHADIYKLWKARSAGRVYDFEGHVAVAEEMDRAGRLPSTFMLLPPHSEHPDVWTDITRMRTLNGAQHAAGREMHLCPLQFDIVDRAIVQYSMKGETVFDPFGGIMTVPYCAMKLGRRGIGVELSTDYYLDGIWHLEKAERAQSTPSLFDALEVFSQIPQSAEIAAASDGLELADDKGASASTYQSVTIEAEEMRSAPEPTPVTARVEKSARAEPFDDDFEIPAFLRRIA